MFECYEDRAWFTSVAETCGGVLSGIISCHFLIHVEGCGWVFLVGLCRRGLGVCVEVLTPGCCCGYEVEELCSGGFCRFCRRRRGPLKHVGGHGSVTIGSMSHWRVIVDFGFDDFMSARMLEG